MFKIDKMKSKELTQMETDTQKIQLVKGNFTATEASEVIMNLINEKINFHKLQRLQMWEKDHEFNTDPLNARIKELKKEKEIAKEFIENLKSSGQKIKINGVLELSVE